MRHAIEQSWRRCAASGLARDTPAPAYAPDEGAAASLRAAAAPVLDRLEDLLTGTETSVYIANASAVMLDRRCPDRSLARVLDARNAAPGFVWSEERTGTTGLGTALETREFTWVAGDEHYIDEYAWAVDAGVPIVHPITGRMSGALGLTCPNHVDIRHLNVVLRQAAAGVTESLYETASRRERLLLHRFLEATRQGSAQRAVLVLSDRMMLSNPAAARLLGGAGSEVLWEQAVDAVAYATEVTSELRLDGDDVISARFERIDDRSGLAGVMATLEAPASSRRRAGGTHRLEDDIARCAVHAKPVLVVGERGAGKYHTAARIAPEPLRVIDAALAPVRGDDAVLRELAAQLEDREGAVLIRHVECFGRRSLATLAALLRGPGPRIVATADDAIEPAWATLFAVRVDVPPLRDRLEDLPTIVHALIERSGARGRMLPAAIRALSQQEWEGNIGELATVVTAALEGRRTADVTVRDLPPEYQARPPRRLTRMEQVERSAIVRALTDAGGNRTRAAELAGIGRATLYRKIRAYGLDTEATLI